MRTSILRPSGQFPSEARPTGCASTILLAMLVCLLLGIVALVGWGATGNVNWVVSFFRIPGALLTVSFALIEFWLCRRVRTHFLPGEALHSAWAWIGLSAFCQLFSAIFTQVLSLSGGINPLAILPGWSETTGTLLREFGLVLGGTFRYGLLAVGLLGALFAYRRANLLGRFRLVDWLLLGTAIAYVGREFADVAFALRNGKHPDLLEVAGWPVDPLLVLLFGEALLLHRSVRGMGRGWISRCWSAYSVGIFLVLLGDLGILLTNYAYLVWPWNAVVWYIWLPASCAFALAPAYQLETIYLAVTEGKAAKPGS